MVPSPKLLTRAILPLFASIALTSVSSAATYNKAPNAVDLDDPNSWGGTVPTSLDIANWNAGSGNNSTASLGSDQTWGTVQVKDATGTVTINGPGTLTLVGTGGGSVGINADSGTTADLTINTNIITVGGAQSWNVRSGRTLTLGGAITATNTALTLGSGGGDIEVTGSLSTTKQVLKKGGGTLVLSGSNNITTAQFILNEGTVVLTSANSVGIGISVNDGGGTGVAQLQLTNSFDSIYSVNANNAHGNARTTGAHLVNVNGTHSIANVNIGTSVGSYGIRSDAGTLSVAAVLGNSVTKPDVRTIEIGGDGDIVVRGGITDASATANKVLTVTKFGTGILTVEGASTYEGATTVEAGTMLVNNTNTSSLMTVKTGATLGGKGTVKTVLVENGGTVTAGNINTVSTLKTGDFTLAGTYAAKLGKAAGRSGQQGLAGTDYDQVSATGSITLSGADLKLTLQTGMEENDLYFIVKNGGTGAVAGTFATLNGTVTDLSQGAIFDVNGRSFQISYTADSTTNSFTGGKDIALLVVAVPEPGTWGMVLGGLGVVIILSRAQRRAKAC